MKIITIVVLAFIVSAGYSQSDCNPYVPTSKGAKWEITNYTSKGKETGKLAYELVDVVKSGDDIKFTIKAISYDKKGEETFSNMFDAYCKNGKFEFDMTFKMNGEALQSYEDMDINIDATEFEIPSMDAAPGTPLKDGSLVVDVGSNSVHMFKMTVLVTDRKVEAREDIKTPAGDFDCLKLSQNIRTKMIIGIEASSIEWYTEEVGMVRSESYSKKGKLSGYSELTKFEK
jgi:hypothetical protein